MIVGRKKNQRATNSSDKYFSSEEGIQHDLRFHKLFYELISIMKQLSQHRQQTTQMYVCVERNYEDVSMRMKEKQTITPVLALGSIYEIEPLMGVAPIAVICMLVGYDKSHTTSCP